MKALLLILTAIAASSALILLTNVRAHQKLDQHLIVKNLSFEGSCIGVVVDDLRKSAQLPVKSNEFFERYNQFCRIKWQVSTNSSGEMLFSFKGKALWSVACVDGSVHRIGVLQPLEVEIVKAIQRIDFSRPCPDSNQTALDSEQWSILKRESDMIRRSYSISADK